MNQDFALFCSPKTEGKVRKLLSQAGCVEGLGIRTVCGMLLCYDGARIPTALLIIMLLLLCIMYV